MGHSDSDDRSGGLYHDFRITDYYSRTYADDWGVESVGGQQRFHSSDIPVIFCFPYRKGNVLGKCHRTVVLSSSVFFEPIKLDPATYYVNAVPVELHLGWIVLLNVCTLLVSVGMLVGPSYLISHIHPAKSIRFE